jgi:carboxypeptidase family protein
MNSLMCGSKNSMCVGAREAMRALGVSLALLLICLPAYSQLNLGRIFGGIADQSGGVIAGATITVVDVARGVSRSLITDSAGGYSAPSLVPSTYTVRAEFKGFRTLERQNVVLGVGQDLRLDLTLQPGEQTQTVTVTEAIPIIDTANAVISTTLQSQAISELPINGRLYTKLLDFQPGLSGAPGGNSPTYSSNGAGIFAQDWMLDGVEDTNAFAASGPLIGAATSQDELTVLPMDAIQEVNVIVNNPPAQFGWQQGAFVNVGLKSGTNNLHGTAYAFGRDQALDAKNPFLNGPPALPKQDDYVEQFGASVGGPIRKDKLFYFANYEGFRYTVGVPNFVSIPSSVAGGGLGASLPDTINAMAAASVPVSQMSLNLAGCGATPLGSNGVPTGPAVCDSAKGVFTNGSTNTNVPRGLDDIGTSNNVVGKIDYHMNDRNSLNGEYFFGNANDNSAGVGVQPYWVNGNHNRTQALRAVWIWTPNSNWVNEARFGYDRYDLKDYNAECTQKLGQPDYAKDFGFVSGVTPPSPECGFPIVQINGFSDLGAGEFIADQLVFQNTYHYLDSVSYTRGKHVFKFGGEFHHTLYRGYGAPSCWDGCVQFGGTPTVSSLQQFLAGTPTGGQLFVGGVQTVAGFNRYAGFFQDDWRITPRLTLNLGLRYEFEPPVQESNNAFGNFDPTTPTGMVQQASGHALYNPDYRDFAPRLGLAWDVTGKGTTVVHAGSSIVYDTIPLDDLLTFQGANLASVPTGFTLVNPDGTTTVSSSGTIKTGIDSIPGGQLQANWGLNTPIFQAGSGSALQCGNGLGQVNPTAPTDPVTNPANPAPCGLQVKPTHAPRSYMTTWNLGVEHAFTNSLSVMVAYVGNHATELPNYININQPTLGPSTGEQLRQPYYSKFPWLGQILEYAPVGFSNYHALQSTLVARNYHGLTFQAEYTWSHSLNTQNGDNFAYVQDSTNVRSSYGNSANTPLHHFGFTVTYVVPSKKSPAQLLEGWEINTAVNVLSAAAFYATDPFTDLSGSGSGGGIEPAPFNGTNWTLVGRPGDFNNLGRVTQAPCFGATGSSFGSFPGCSPTLPQACITAATNESVNATMNAAVAGSSSGLASLNSFGCYMEGNSVIIPPAQGTFGTMSRNALRGAPFREWDLSVSKK